MYCCLFLQIYLKTGFVLQGHLYCLKYFIVPLSIFFFSKLHKRGTQPCKQIWQSYPEVVNTICLAYEFINIYIYIDIYKCTYIDFLSFLTYEVLPNTPLWCWKEKHGGLFWEDQSLCLDRMCWCSWQYYLALAAVMHDGTCLSVSVCNTSHLYFYMIIINVIILLKDFIWML